MAGSSEVTSFQPRAWDKGTVMTDSSALWVTCLHPPQEAAWSVSPWPLSPLPHPHRFWRQMGGHLRIVEANARGVVWGIGYDRTAWVYTGGYSGGCFQGEEAPPTALPGPPLL